MILEIQVWEEWIVACLVVSSWVFMVVTSCHGQWWVVGDGCCVVGGEG